MVKNALIIVLMVLVFFKGWEIRNDSKTLSDIAPQTMLIRSKQRTDCEPESTPCKPTEDRKAASGIEPPRKKETQ